MKLRLRLDVNYAMSDDSAEVPGPFAEQLFAKLRDVAENAFNSGMLTGDLSDVCVRTMTARVDRLDSKDAEDRSSSDNTKGYREGDHVVVPDPIPGSDDAWCHSFVGSIYSLWLDWDTNLNMLTVADMDGDLFDVEYDRVSDPANPA